SPCPFARAALYENGAAHGLHLRYSRKPRGNGGVFSDRTVLASAGDLVRSAGGTRSLIEWAADDSSVGIAAPDGGNDRPVSSAQHALVALLQDHAHSGAAERLRAGRQQHRPPKHDSVAIQGAVLSPRLRAVPGRE